MSALASQPTAGGPDLKNPDLYVDAMPYDVFAALRRDAPVHWNPETDATAIASRLLANQNAGMRTEAIAAELGWPVRRLNPALSILVDANAVLTSNEKSHPEIRNWMQATHATRRFVKSRS